MAGNGFEGSSPHVRGAPYRRSSVCLPHGIIPACAGSTCRVGFQPLPIGDHPRMCGEHRSDIDGMTEAAGSSPHVRGAPLSRLEAPRTAGIIPACAGSTFYGHVRQHRRRDHPRMCGEHGEVFNSQRIDRGSSPHVRGARSHSMFTARQHGIIPACAGSTSAGLNHAGGTRDHPRMCGEHARRSLQHGQGKGSSPHVRGALRRISRWKLHRGIIPACAGSTQE